MRIKRVCAVSIAFILVFALFSCADSKQNLPTKEPEATKEVVVATPTPTATVVKTPEPTPTPVPTPEIEEIIPEVAIETEEDTEWKKVREEIEADKIITAEEIVKFLDALQVSYSCDPVQGEENVLGFVLYTTGYKPGVSGKEYYPVILYVTDEICSNWDENIEYIENNPEKFVKKISTLEELTNFICFWNFDWEDAFTVSFSDDSKSFVVKCADDSCKASGESFIVPLDENGEISVVELEKIVLDNISVVIRGKNLILPKPWTFIENWDD